MTSAPVEADRNAQCGRALPGLPGPFRERTTGRRSAQCSHHAGIVCRHGYVVDSECVLKSPARDACHPAVRRCPADPHIDREGGAANMAPLFRPRECHL